MREKCPSHLWAFHRKPLASHHRPDHIAASTYRQMATSWMSLKTPYLSTALQHPCNLRHSFIAGGKEISLRSIDCLWSPHCPHSCSITALGNKPPGDADSQVWRLHDPCRLRPRARCSRSRDTSKKYRLRISPHYTHHSSLTTSKGGWSSDCWSNAPRDVGSQVWRLRDPRHLRPLAYCARRRDISKKYRLFSVATLYPQQLHGGLSGAEIAWSNSRMALDRGRQRLTSIERWSAKDTPHRKGIRGTPQEDPPRLGK